VKSTNYEAPHYAAISTVPFLRLRSQHPFCVLFSNALKIFCLLQVKRPSKTAGKIVIQNQVETEVKTSNNGCMK